MTDIGLEGDKMENVNKIKWFAICVDKSLKNVGVKILAISRGIQDNGGHNPIDNVT